MPRKSATFYSSVANLVTSDDDLLAFPPVGPSVVERVLLCGALMRRQIGYRAAASSLPGHLIQLTLSGKAAHEVNGRRYVMKPGRLIWYYQDEMVQLTVRKAPWTILTLNFLASGMAPPPFESRVHDVPPSVTRLFVKLLHTWRDTSVGPEVRHWRVHGQINQLLAGLSVQQTGQTYSVEPSAELWWRIETQLRSDLFRPISLDIMAELSGRSIATIARSCRAAVRCTPIKRMRHVRLSLARGLVQRSDILFKEIAARVGYTRVHEFSRDYRRYFQTTPTADRAAAARQVHRR